MSCLQLVHTLLIQGIKKKGNNTVIAKKKKKKKGWFLHWNTELSNYGQFSKSFSFAASAHPGLFEKKMDKRKSSNLAAIFLGMPTEEGGVKYNNGKDLL